MTAISTPCPASAVAGSKLPYQLYSHCGIDEARIGDRYFEAVHPLSNGQATRRPGKPVPARHDDVAVASRGGV